MRIRFALALALLSFPALADDFPLQGKWAGSGSIDGGQGATKSRFELEIKRTQASLSLRECWFQPSAPEKRSCIDSTYALEDGYKVMHEGRRIGEAYPWSVRIFLGETMVSEQMVLDLDDQGTLSYRYNYANYDGEMVVRKAELRK